MRLFSRTNISVLWVLFSVATDWCFLRYDSAMHVLRSTLKKDGVKGLFRGWVLTLFKVAPAAGISFGAYSAITDQFSALRRQQTDERVSGKADSKK